MSICGDCHKDDEGCCDSGESGIFITLHDALRISNATGMKIEEFAVFGSVPQSWLDELKEKKDEFLDYYIDGKILQFKLINKKCIFLMQNGCKIFEHRSGLCRLFPFTYQVEEGVVKIELIKDCCRMYKLSTNKALNAMGENENDFKEFIKKYDEECQMYPTYAKELSEGIPFDEVIRKFNIKV